MNTIKGKILGIKQEMTFDTGFKKREIIVETLDEKYPQTLPINFIGDNVQKLNDYKEGDEVEMSINIRGNEYKERHYVNLECWKINVNKPE